MALHVTMYFIVIVFPVLCFSPCSCRSMFKQNDSVISDIVTFSLTLVMYNIYEIRNTLLKKAQ